MSKQTDSRTTADRQLRRALDPDAASAERITRVALAAGNKAAGNKAAGFRTGPWLMAAALVVLSLALWLRPEPSRPRAELAVPEGGILIANHGAVLTVRDPSGRIWLRQGSGGLHGPGPRLVIIKGDSDG